MISRVDKKTKFQCNFQIQTSFEYETVDNIITPSTVMRFIIFQWVFENVTNTFFVVVKIVEIHQK